MIDLLTTTSLALGLSLLPSTEVIERMGTKWAEIDTDVRTASGTMASFRVLVTQRQFCEIQPLGCAHWHKFPHFSGLLPGEVEISGRDFRRRYRQEDYCAMGELDGAHCSLAWLVLQAENNNSGNEKPSDEEAACQEEKCSN